jgi:PAS domain S-box-containing protein
MSTDARAGSHTGPAWTRSVGWLAFLAVVLAGVGATVAAQRYERGVHDRELRERVDLVARGLGDEMTALLETEFSAAAATAAAVSADPGLDRASFSRFATGMRAQLPSLLGIGYVRRVPEGDLESLVATMRRTGAPDFDVAPAGPTSGPEHAILVYNEPAASLRASWGADLRTDPDAAAALDRATASGRPVLTRRLVLFVDRSLPAGEQPAGYVVYAPVYAPGAALDTLEQRREAVVGWANLPFRAQDLLDQLEVPDGFSVALDDGLGDTFAAVIGGADADFRSGDETVIGLPAGLDGGWNLEMVPGSEFSAALTDRSGFAVAIGLALTALLSGLVALLASGGRRWTRAAERATRTLAESEQQLRATISAAPDLLLVVDHDGRIVSASERARQLLGVEPRALVGRSVEDITRASPSSDAPGGLDDGELWARRDDGARVPVEVTSSPLRPGDPVTPSILIVRDVTVRRQAQESLAAHARDLERSNRDLEEFASIAAHDLSEPLTVVGGYADLLQQRYPPGQPLDEDAVVFLDTITAAVQRMSALLRGLLRVSRLRADTQHLGPVELRSVVDAALANLEAAVRESGAVVDVGDLPTVWGDAEHLVQLVQNLVANAIRYRDPSRHPVVTITAVRAGPSWEVSVADNGIGIAAEHQDRVFTMFGRVHSEREKPGLGIGLALCRRVVDLHGGELRLASEPGVGSTFTFTLQPAPTGSTSPILSEVSEP